MAQLEPTSTILVPDTEESSQSLPRYSENALYIHPGQNQDELSSLSETSKAPSIQQNALINRHFPPSFSLYRVSKLGRTLMLGQHRNQPLYAVSLHSGFSGRPDVVLHNAPSTQAPALATVDNKPFHQEAIVTLPPIDPASDNGRRVEERLERRTSLGTAGTDGFSIEVEPDGHREAFEWRHSHGAEVKAIGGQASGYKLVRLSADIPATSDDLTSDGKEVVAVWADAKMSFSKQLKFHFLDGGPNGDGLGERWAIMAVITALRLWDRERRAKLSAGRSRLADR